VQPGGGEARGSFADQGNHRGYVPEGQVAHSRNIPEDKRAEFVAAVEAKAGIEFAG
jgi:hypothetical protein